MINLIIAKSLNLDCITGIWDMIYIEVHGESVRHELGFTEEYSPLMKIDAGSLSKLYFLF